MNFNRRKFIKETSLASAAFIAGVSGLSQARGAMSAKSYRRIIGSNDRLNVGVVGFSSRAKSSLIPAIKKHSKNQNCQIIGVSDIWNRRRDEGKAFIEEYTGNSIETWRNNEEMYEKNKIDSVIISTADFQHAIHTVEAAESKKDVYVEKPLLMICLLILVAFTFALFGFLIGLMSSNFEQLSVIPTLVTVSYTHLTLPTSDLV